MEIFNKMIASALNIAERQVSNTLSLLNGGATIPFISRYRKEATGGLDEVQIGIINILESFFFQKKKILKNSKNKKKFVSPNFHVINLMEIIN